MVIPRAWTGHWRATFFLLVSASSVFAQQRDGSVSFKADSVTLDLQLGRSVYRSVVVSDGRTSISAAEGTTRSLEAGSGVWEFQGGLRITVDAAVLTANGGTFQYANGRLTQGELLGAATLIGSEPRLFHLTAGRISYDALKQILKVSEDAVFSSDGVELEKCSWVYDLGAKTVQGSSEGESPCKGRVKPKASGP